MSEKKTQSERFEGKARDLGIDLDEGKLKEALRRMKKPQPDNDKKDGG